MRSIIEQLGTEKFPRLRLGVGRPSGSKAAAGYVLKDFRGEDLEIITSTLERAADAAETFVRDGLTTAMNRYNGAAEPQ
jgi:PTH1 family peptidyl-tRNA hydrolase